MSKKSKLIILIFFFVFNTSFTLALENQYPQIQGASTPVSVTGDFTNFVAYVFYFAIGIGIAAVFGIILWSGYRYLPSRDDPAVVADIKEKLRRALIGLLVLVSSYLILNTINPEIFNFSFAPLATFSNKEANIEKTEPSATTIFQEIPLGTIIEDLLAGNASTSTHPSARCYKYDGSGNTVDVNKDGKIDEKDTFDYNMFYCAQLLNKAFEIKIKSFQDKTEKELKPLLNSCSCSICKDYPLALPPYYGCKTITIQPKYCKANDPCCIPVNVCDSHCDCCGSPGGKNKGCPGVDPCPNRVAINCKRQELKQLIDGKEMIGDNKKANPCYNPKLDPKNDPRILTLEEAQERMVEFANVFKEGLYNLKEAEKLMKNPYGERLTMGEFFALKQNIQEPIERVTFSYYDVSNYCLEYNCTATNDEGACTACGLNKKNRACKIDDNKTEDEKDDVEYYVKSGDGATFYFNEEYKQTDILKGQKRAIDPKEEKGVPIGLIPIGETVDETEAFAEKIAALYDYLLASYKKSVSSAWNLYNSPEECDCGLNCTNEPICYPCPCPPCAGYEGCWPGHQCCAGCTSCEPQQKKKNLKDPTKPLTKRVPDICGCPSGSDPWPTHPVPVAEESNFVCSICKIEADLKKISNRNDGFDKGNYPCCDFFVEKNEQNIDILKARLKNLTKEDEKLEAKNEYGFCNQKFDSLPGNVQIIENIIKRMSDLMNAQNLEEGDLNKCRILDKLTLVRERAQKCITGFGVAVKTGMTEMSVLNCREAWDAVRLGRLIILPGFPYPKSDTQLNCYPFNSGTLTDKEKLQCFSNIHSSECGLSTQNLLDNYYCCSGSRD
jgi:hypothetical protein